MAKKASKKTAKKAVKKASPPAARAKARRAAGLPADAKLDELRKKFLRPRAAKQPTGKSDAIARDSLSAAAGSAQEVVRAAMPRVRIVQMSPGNNSDAPRQATAQGAGLNALRGKYGGLAPIANHADAATTADSSEIVMVDSPSTDAVCRGPGPKAIIVSGGKIIGRQG